jgi:uncharacterized iron-regulated membrane protein
MPGHVSDPQRASGAQPGRPRARSASRGRRRWTRPREKRGVLIRVLTGEFCFKGLSDRGRHQNQPMQAHQGTQTPHPRRQTRLNTSSEHTAAMRRHCSRARGPREAGNPTWPDQRVTLPQQAQHCNARRGSPETRRSCTPGTLGHPAAPQHRPPELLRFWRPPLASSRRKLC